MSQRFGIGEWYGHAFERLAIDRRKYYAASPATETCPFTGSICKKKGGVCSFLLYDEQEGRAIPVGGEVPRILCPNRFHEDDIVIQWIGETLLGTKTPQIVTEVPFLRSEKENKHVGRIDMVLVHQDGDAMEWCAVEMQAVYFSGASMNEEFKRLLKDENIRPPFPAVHRRPDYRSSGPKRLMPQLQIKVPTIRRWGKKLAVIVDKPFFDALGRMDVANDISNADVLWFILSFERTNGRFRLVPDRIHATTLERATEGLTGGVAVPKHVFEKALTKNKGKR